MKKLLNTLFVTTQGAYLKKDGECVVVMIEREAKLRLPIHTLSGIVCFGQVSCSPFLMWLCGERGVHLSFLSENGRFLARVTGPQTGNVLLRREQYRRMEEKSLSIKIARNCVLGKIANCRTVLRRGLRDHPAVDENKTVSNAVKRLDNVIDTVRIVSDIDTLRGVEGDAAKLYFSALDCLITTGKEEFFMRERSRRPPMDKFNALLSFLYTLLAHDIEGALEAVGLDPQVGMYHALRPGRPGLALDVMEEFRPVMADRMALNLVNLRQVNAKGFKISESGAVVMDDDTRKTVLTAWQKRKKDELKHPFLEKSIPLGLLPYTQALLLARHLRGDLDAYPPFIWR